MCEIVGGLIFVLGVIWLIGFVLVKAFNGLIAFLSGDSSRSKHIGPACPRCGRRLPSARAVCRFCEDASAFIATSSEAADLDVTLRQLALLHAEELLDQATFERVQQAIGEFRQQLAESTKVPLWRQLNRLLVAWPHVGQMPLGQRRQALEWYGQLPDKDQPRLLPQARFLLARLFHLNEDSEAALRLYRWVAEGPDTVYAIEAAFAAGCLAAECHRDAEARSFLEQARAGNLSREDRVAVERLLEKLAQAEEEIVDVLPVAASPPEVSEPALPGRIDSPSSPAPVAPPRRTFGEMMAGFMEERNILWGELLGGLLMVGSSIALVISLWVTLQEIPFFPFLIFSAITAAIYGAGLYTLSHWKLASTSHGLLVIATLLVPLDFLVMAALIQAEVDPGMVRIVFRLFAEAATLGLFAYLGLRAARVLTPAGVWLLPLTVLGASASQLLVPRVFGHDVPGLIPFLVLSLLPVLCHLVGTGLFLRRVTKAEPLEVTHANAAFTFLGLASFTVAVVFGFLIFQSLEVGAGLHRLAVPLALAAIPLLWGGFAVYRGLAAGPTTGLPRTIGTAVGLGGAAVMLAALVLAWPQPAALIGVGGLNFLVLTAAALRYRLPLAHLLALPCLALACVIGFHQFDGGLAVPAGELGARLLQLLHDSQTGMALLPLVLLTAVAAEVCMRGGHGADALAYARGAGLLGSVSLLLVSPDWYHRPVAAAWTYGLYGVALLAGNLRLRQNYFGAAGSVLLHLAVLFGVIAWLKTQPDFSGFPASLADPNCVQSFGIGLAGLGLLGVAVRLRLRRWGEAAWLNDGWALVDRVALTLILGTQLFVAAAAIAPEVVRELTPVGQEPNLAHWPAVLANAYGPGGWLLLGVVAALLVLTLWERSADALHGLVLVALTVPLLAAGQFSEAQASATALRWGYGFSLLACSVLVWLREPLTRGAAGLRIPAVGRASIATLVRRLLVGGMLGPILALTAAVALVVLSSGVGPTGPLRGSFFHQQVGWIGSNLGPLLLAIVALVGYAVRERSSGYAFGAGLIAIATVPGGYLLHLVILKEPLTEARFVQLFQLGTVTAAVWALGWLVSRRWVYAWREHAETPLPGQLMSLQLALVVAGNLYLLGMALLALVQRFPEQASWTTEAGRPLGWIMWLLAALAALRLSSERSWSRSLILGVTGVLAVGLVTCTVAGQWPGAEYRTLMLGTAGSALVLALSAFVRARRREAIDEVTATWDLVSVGVGYLILGVILLAVRTALLHHDHLWAAGALALSGAAAALLGLRQREEVCAFAAGLLFTLAAGFVVWHGQYTLPVAQWWVLLVQHVLLAGAVWAIVWLAARHWLYGTSTLTLGSSPFLGAQAVVLLIGQCNLLLVPLIQLLSAPAGRPTVEMVQAGQLAGWLGWFLTATAALGYAFQVLPRAAIQVTALAGLLLGILAACLASTWGDSWLAYHVLTTCWSLLGLLILVAGWVGSKARVVGPVFWSLKRRVRAARRLAVLFPTRAARVWVGVLASIVVALALLGTAADPARPLGGATATLAVSVLLGALAVWMRRPVAVYASGLLVCVVGLLLWRAWLAVEVLEPAQLAWGPGVLDTFVLTQVLCLAVASAVWSLIDAALRARTPPVVVRGAFVPFSHLAAWLGLNLLAALVLGGLGSDLQLLSMYLASPFARAAVGAVALAMLLCLWDFEAPFSLAALYTTGLLALGLLLHGHVESFGAAMRPVELCWTAPLALAPFILLTAILAWHVPRLTPVWRLLRLSVRPESWPMTWCVPAQALIALLVICLTVWMSYHFDTLGARLAGPLAFLLLLPAGMLLTGLDRSLPEQLRPLHLVHAVTLFFGAILFTELGWALLGPLEVAPWLHRTVLLLVSLLLMTGVTVAALPRLLPAASAWLAAGRRMTPVFGGLAGLALLAVLAQEAVHYDPVLHRTPMQLWGMVVVALALLATAAGAIGVALRPAADPLELSERGRMGYVYGAEFVLVLLGAHLRLNHPGLDDLLRAYWPFLTMATAYVAIGLSELCHRRGVRVLAEPLQWTGALLPLVPLLAFWVRPSAEFRDWAADSVRGLQPFLRYLDALSHSYGHHAGLWGLAALLYTLVAAARQSPRFTLLAALAANFGLWAMWVEVGVHFLDHPQLWLIPVALIVLAAEHINRDRLQPAQSAGLRYLALGMLYVSSTADMFITGLGESVLLPVVLAVLAILGVLSGILLRVQAFLFMGAGFLFLDVFSQIWYAAVGRRQTWVWYASGIVLGAAIIALFAVFEKRRQDVVRVVEEIRQWD